MSIQCRDKNVFPPGQILDLGNQTATVCPSCHCLGEYVSETNSNKYCDVCGGSGFVRLDGGRLDASGACDKLPGSRERVAMFAIRYAAGLPLWDCRDATEAVNPVFAIPEQQETFDDDED